MIKKRGFTLVEVLISLGIFVYVFSSLILLFFQFSKGNTNKGKCSSFSLIKIQKILTETNMFEISSTTDEAEFDTLILRFEPGSLYLFQKTERNNFQSKKNDFKLDDCEADLFKNSTTTISLLNGSKCLKLKYKQGGTQEVCALK